MKQARKVLCIIGVGIVAALLTVGTVYACCGMYPEITDDPIETACVGDEVTISGTLSSTNTYGEENYTTDATMAIEVQPPSGGPVALDVTLTLTLDEPPSASFDFTATYTPTEAGTYTYTKTATWWTPYPDPVGPGSIESDTVVGTFEVIVCNEPPDCSGASAGPDCLWPPNNKMVLVNILGVTDPDGDPVTITITSITSDEATASEKGAGGPKHAPDAAGVGMDTAMLRAERSGNGNGRVYEISFNADDGNGGECNGSVTVCVPHDQSEECERVDDGQIYDATQIN